MNLKDQVMIYIYNVSIQSSHSGDLLPLVSGIPENTICFTPYAWRIAKNHSHSVASLESFLFHCLHWQGKVKYATILSWTLKMKIFGC